jgi:hypothetical protein
MKRHFMKPHGHVEAQLQALTSVLGGSVCFTLGVHWTAVWVGSTADFDVLNNRNITSLHRHYSN